MLEGLSAGIAVFDGRRRLVRFNRIYAAMFGLVPDWLAAGPEFSMVLAALMDARMLPDVADPAAFRAAELARFNQPPGEPAETLIHLPDGRSMRQVATALPGGGLVIAFEDVTRVLSLARGHNEDEAVQRVTLDALTDAVAAFGSDGRLRLANAAFASLWGLNGDRVASGRGAGAVARDMAARLHAQTGAGLRPLWSALSQRRSDAVRLILDDGLIVAGSARPLPDGAGLLTFRDVTDSARLEAALADRDAAIAAADRAKTAFIANVSREVDGPLNAVGDVAGMLADGAAGPLNPRQTAYAEAIRDGTAGLGALMRDILDLAAIDAGQTVLSPVAVDAPALLAGALGLVRERAKARRVQLILDCPADLGPVLADARRLKQALLELLENAITHTPARGTVTLGAERRDGGMTIAVSDTGPGLPPADRERVFLPFERGTSETEATGAGLGLALARRFVEMHGGRVDLTSRPKRGTTVRCWLPDPPDDAERD